MGSRGRACWFVCLAMVVETSLAAEYAELAQRLEAFIEAERKAKNLPAVSIALVDGDRLAWSGGFGPADATTGRTADADSVYRVGSVSKLFADLALMQLVAEDKVDLDAEVRAYVPDFAPQNDHGVPITVRQLMTHQAGLVREPPVGHYFDPSEPSMAETVRSLNDTKLVHQPGIRTKYSNAALTVVGVIVERVSGRPFEDYAEESLLRPLRMHKSGFRRNKAIDGRLVSAWMWSQHLERFPAPQFALGTLSAGNLYASMNDLSNFLIMLSGGGEFSGRRIIPAETIEQMLRPTPSAGGDANTYGIGFRLGELDGRRTFGHGGAVYGFAAQVVGLPDERLGVAAAVALDGGGGFIRRLTDYALRLMIAHREGKPLPEIELSRPLAVGVAHELAGVYTSDGERLELQEYDGRLLLRYKDSLNEVRALDGGLVVDDATAFGPKFTARSSGTLELDGKTWRQEDDACPPPCPEKWKGLVGEYGWDHNVLYIYEDRGQLWCLIEWFYYYPLTEVAEDVFAFPDRGLYPGEQIVFERDKQGRATQAVAASVVFKRRPIGNVDGDVFRIRPTRPIDQLRSEALAAEPPQELRPRRQPDLLELRDYDATIRYDIRYASERNFLGAKIYDSAHAFLQRPAAEALARAQQQLKTRGYGLLIHDAYRPWYVTKIFWDATPPHLHSFVADPEQGSRHNRGCAVDLTLYELATGEPVSMVGLYDEMTPRSFPLYPGGEHRQRWHRELLRSTMERQGFTVYPYEWWHFDYKDWQQYPIVNRRFEELQTSGAN